MLAILTISLYLLIPAFMLGLKLWKPRFPYFWLVAALANLVVWPLILFLWLRIPEVIPLTTWSPRSDTTTPLELLLDPFSWSFGLALATINLAIVLTDVTRPTERNWSAWAGGMALTGLGILAVFSGNPLTLLLAWQAIDLVEVVALLSQGFYARDREPVVGIFGARIAGSILVMAAILIAASQGQSLTFENLTPAITVLLIVGAGLRLGTLPFYAPLFQNLPSQQGLFTLFRLVPAASSLILLARAAQVGVPANAVPWFLGLLGLLGIYSSLAWLTAADEVAGRPFWILGMASLAMASAVLARSSASLAWGMALLLPGSMLFLASTRTRRLLFLPAIGLISLSCLPYTPTWAGLQLYSTPFHPLVILLLFAQAFLWIGYARHSLRMTRLETGIERWAWTLYILGLVLPLVIFFIASYWNGTLLEGPNLTQNWPLLVIYSLAGAAYFIQRRGVHLRFPQPFGSFLRNLASLTWVLFSVTWIYSVLRRTTAFISLILEGEGGVLWSILLLVLLLTVIAGASFGR